MRGAQSSGASLISYNADAFCSYGKEQGENAGISQQAAFAYTTALNYLLSDHPTHLWNTATQEKVDPQKSRFRYASQLGDTTVVYWAEGGDPAYQEFYHGMIEPESLSDAKEEVDAVLSNLTNGKTVDIQGMELDPGVQFYILGISPNAARLSVRFFLQDSFGVILGRIQEHQQRLEIVKPVRDPRENLSFWQLLQETVNPNSKDKNPAPLLGGALVRSVLEGLPYPAALLEGVFVRLRAERNINRRQSRHLKSVLFEKSKFRLSKGGFNRGIKQRQQKRSLSSGTVVCGVGGDSAGRQPRYQRYHSGQVFFFRCLYPCRHLRPVSAAVPKASGKAQRRANDFLQQADSGNH